MFVGLADAHPDDLALAVGRSPEHEVERERVTEHVDARADRRLVERALHFGTRAVAAGVDDAVVAVPALAGQRDVGAALFGVERRAESHEVPNRLRGLGHELAHDILVAQAGACFERVTDVVVDRVARVEHPCQASLGPLGRAGGEDVLGDHQHAADRASRERSGQPRCPGAEHDHVDIAFPGRGRRRQAPRQVHVTRPLPTVCRWRSSARPRGGLGRRSRGRRTPRRCPHEASARVSPA